MVWWTFNKQEGLLKYNPPEEVKTNEREFKKIPKELGFSEFHFLEVGQPHIDYKNFSIEGYKVDKGKAKVPFEYLLWVRLGNTSVEGVFIRNFPELVEFLKYVSDIPLVLTHDTDTSVDMIAGNLRQIADNINSVSSAIDGE